MRPGFITGTGTGIGKTIVSVIVSNALKADYWKPIQAGNIDGTDTKLFMQLSNTEQICHPEVYNLSTPASPHIAARNENKLIDIDLIKDYYSSIRKSQPDSSYLVIEGAGGLLVPLNSDQFVADLILSLKARVILVSRNYLGSINHSLLTAEVCRQRGVEVVGWVFNDEYMQYQNEIVTWSGYPLIATIPKLEMISRESLSGFGSLIRERLLQLLEKKV